MAPELRVVPELRRGLEHNRTAIVVWNHRGTILVNCQNRDWRADIAPISDGHLGGTKELSPLLLNSLVGQTAPQNSFVSISLVDSNPIGS